MVYYIKVKRPIIIERLNLKKLLDFIKNNNLAIPEFQRGFVWREKHVKNLFDSLVKKYPIGSFIVWRTKQKIGIRNLFVKEPKKSNQRYLILDGQQRLLSIYYLCRQDEFLKVKELFEEVYQHKEKNLLEFEHFYFDNKRNPKLFYSNEKTLDFNRKEFQKRIGDQYLFPLIIVSIDDYQKAIEIFERINQSGTKISTESIFLSEAWNKKTNLGKILREWKNDNKDTISSKLENIIFIHTLAIIIQLEKLIDDNDKNNSLSIDVSLRQLKKIAEKIREKKTKIYEREFRKILKAITETMSFLEREYKIKKINELPSQTLVSILSTFFYYCEDPTKKQTVELKKWFWRSSLGSRYVGSGYNENIRKDPIKMKKLAKNKKPLNIPKVDLKHEDIINTDMYAGRSTIRNSIKLMLWNRKPQWINGNELNRYEVESKKRKKEDDHFYPYDLCRKNILRESEVNNILNLCYLPKSENSIKSANLPSKWLDSRKKELKPKDEDEKQFFLSNLLPFESINKLKNNELGLTTQKGLIRPKKFKEYYQKFLKRRFELFQKGLNRLQKGK